MENGRLQKTVEILGIEFLDPLIIADNPFLSLKELWLSGQRRIQNRRFLRKYARWSGIDE